MMQMAMLFDKEGKALIVRSGATIEDALLGLLQHPAMEKVRITKKQRELVVKDGRLQLGKERIEIGEVN